MIMPSKAAADFIPGQHVFLTCKEDEILYNNTKGVFVGTFVGILCEHFETDLSTVLVALQPSFTNKIITTN